MRTWFKKAGWGVATCCLILFFAIAAHSAEGRPNTGRKQESKKGEEAYEATWLSTRVLELIRQEYVDPSKTEYRSLIYAGLRGMLENLDPHSQFLDEEALAELQKETKGEFSGVGLVVTTQRGQLIVSAPMEDTPGFRAGLLPGDRILKIDGKTTETMPLHEATKRLRGERGEPVTLTIGRSAAGDPSAAGQVFEVKLVRELIKVATVRDAKLLPPALSGSARIGYIRIEQLGENTAAEFNRALNQLDDKGMDGLVLDLRNNPGGLLDAAVDIAGEFLPPNQLVVSTEGRKPEHNNQYHSHNSQQRAAYPIVILVNAYSASGAEIIAGALRDLRRAVLLGETTFGKGSVQSVQDLGGGVGLRLTTAHYYTPSHQKIHEVGVSPDIIAPITEQEERALFLARVPLVKAKSAAPPADRQLERAAGIIQGLRNLQKKISAA